MYGLCINKIKARFSFNKKNGLNTVILSESLYVPTPVYRNLRTCLARI